MDVKTELRHYYCYIAKKVVLLMCFVFLTMLIFFLTVYVSSKNVDFCFTVMFINFWTPETLL